MCGECYYRNTKSKLHRKFLDKMADLRDNVLPNYQSAREFVEAEVPC